MKPNVVSADVLFEEFRGHLKWEWVAGLGASERRFDEVAPEPEVAVARHQVPLRFGVMHTDPNNHVNSLVYPRVFEEAAMALRGGIDPARALEVVWRKPIFAGERVTLDQWLCADGEVHGAFLDDTGAARCRLTMRFGP